MRTLTKKLPFTIRDHIPLVIALILSLPALIFLFALLLGPWIAKHDQKVFVDEWSSYLRSHHSLDSANKVSSDGYVYTHTFQDGSLLLASVASSDSGDDFNAAVIVDQEGHVYWSDYGFSGFEGFEANLLELNASSFDDFRKKNQARWMEIKP